METVFSARRRLPELFLSLTLFLAGPSNPGHGPAEAAREPEVADLRAPLFLFPGLVLHLLHDLLHHVLCLQTSDTPAGQPHGGAWHHPLGSENTTGMLIFISQISTCSPTKQECCSGTQRWENRLDYFIVCFLMHPYIWKKNYQK